MEHSKRQKRGARIGSIKEDTKAAGHSTCLPLASGLWCPPQPGPCLAREAADTTQAQAWGTGSEGYPEDGCLLPEAGRQVHGRQVLSSSGQMATQNHSSAHAGQWTEATGLGVTALASSHHGHLPCPADPSAPRHSPSSATLSPGYPPGTNPSPHTPQHLTEALVKPGAQACPWSSPHRDLA